MMNRRLLAWMALALMLSPLPACNNKRSTTSLGEVQSGTAFWNVSCSNGRSYAISIAADETCVVSMKCGARTPLGGNQRGSCPSQSSVRIFAEGRIFA